MALTIYGEVTELDPSFLKHSETREKHHIKSSMMGKIMYFSWKAIVLQCMHDSEKPELATETRHLFLLHAVELWNRFNA